MVYRLILVFLFTSVFVANSQNPRFSQYNFSPIQINPGILSSSNYLTASLLYRNEQFIGDLQYNTFLFTATTPIATADGHKRFGGAGFSAFSDCADASGLLSTQGVSLDYAQNIKITPHSYLSLGLAGTFYQKRNNNEGYTTGNQWIETSGYDPSIANGEALADEAINRFNMGTGLYWYYLDENLLKKAYTGFALYNINRPDEAFSGNPSRLPLDYCFIAGYRVFEKGRTTITPEVLYRRIMNTDYFSPGAMVNIAFENASPNIPLKDGSIGLIARYCAGKAFVSGIQLHQPGYSIGFSFDAASRKNKLAGPGGVTELVFALHKPVKWRKPEQVAEIDEPQIGDERIIQEVKEKEVVVIYKENLPEEEIFIREDSLQFNFKLEKDFKFAFGDATLDDEAKAFLDEIYELMRRNKYLKLEVIGHTDNVGSDEANLIVSEKRSGAVMEYLAGKGIDPARMKAIGKADKVPAYPNTSEKNRAKNRRVEFIIYME